MIDETRDIIISFSNSLLLDCFKAQFFSFNSNYKRSFNKTQVGFGVNSKGKMTTFLLNSKLQDIYERFVYNKRNQIAHNTLSYQYNTQKMKHMSQNEFIHDNFFTRFAVLILIDKIFITLFKEYLDRFVELDFDTSE